MKRKIEMVRALSRREFFGQATAATMLAAGGCLPRMGAGEPRLKVGVLSDIHLLVQKDSMHSDVYFEKALRWYDAQKADAVLLCGDIADCGLSTVTDPDHFYSYRRDRAVTGRHAALVWISDKEDDE